MLHHKSVILLLALLFIIIPSLVLAVIYDTGGKSTPAHNVTQPFNPTGYLSVRVCNTSAKSYFIPTKTSAEFAAFSNHLPSGVTVLRCGDGVCRSCAYGGGETCSTCQNDCGTCADYCGNGLCGTSETCTTCSSDCGTCSTCASASTQSACAHFINCIWDGIRCRSGLSEL